jgi:hypothetical protein
VTQGNSCVIGGVSRLVHPIGRTPDEMTVRPVVGLKLATSPKSGSDRMTQMAALREAFLELEYYLARGDAAWQVVGWALAADQPSGAATIDAVAP